VEKNKDKGLGTMIGEGAVFEGTISVPHGMRIDGTFRGKIDTKEMLTIGTTGVVEADIRARSLSLGGKLTGNIVAEHRVELEANASHIGNLQTKELIINQGAFFNGRCSMGDNPAT
jgi:cytoskeletal protein CcmA (bactofilin family)